MVFNFSKKDKKPNNRKLGERSHLVFEFPGSPGNIARRCYLPMLENCQISESQRSNLSEYSLLGRNSSIYSYMGAKSRNFNLTFKISLLHILTQESSEGIADMFNKQFTVYGLDNATKVAAFFVGLNLDKPELVKGKEHASLHRSYYQKIAKLKNPGLSAFDSGLNSVFSFIGADSLIASDPSYIPVNKIIDLILFWVNLVRSSTKNNSTNTVEGPPIVRINHGTMYNNVPCVVESYTIRIIDDSGYDIQTMTPKQIEISMVLNESRTGDFSKFKSGDDVKGDNNAGWEAVFSENNMDPYNGLVR